MALAEATVKQLAKHLDLCQQQVQDTTKITDDHPNMSWDDAYAVQDNLLQRKLRGGARLVGYKAGLTSHAKMQQMGVNSPVFGFLLDEYAVDEGSEIDTATLIHPKVEPEICFVTRNDLKGPGCNIAQVLAACDLVLPGIEVIDSRYRNFNFDLKSVISDNTSAARYIVGGHARAVRSLDLATTGIVLEKNGQQVAFGAGAAVLGNPAVAVSMLVNHLGKRGQVLPAGSLVLSGGVTAAIAVDAGDNITLRVQDMGSVSVRFR